MHILMFFGNIETEISDCLWEQVALMSLSPYQKARAPLKFFVILKSHLEDF